MQILPIIVNVLAIFVAGILGSILRPKIPASWKRVMVQACGLLALCLGAWGIIRQVTDVTAARSEIEGSVLIIFAAVVGTLLGYTFYVQKGIIIIGQTVGKIFEGMDKGANKKSKAFGALPTDEASSIFLHTENCFNDGLILASVLVCSGSLLISGTMQGHMTMAFIKVGVDAVFVLVLAMVYGDGASLAAIPFLITNVFLSIAHNAGTAFLSSMLLRIKVDGWEASKGMEITESKLTELTETVEKTVATWNTEVIAQASVLAAVIMIAVGVVMAAEKKYKVAHMLPAYAVLYGYQWFVPLLTAAIKG